jgi:hypothetical protein
MYQRQRRNRRYNSSRLRLATKDPTTALEYYRNFSGNMYYSQYPALPQSSYDSTQPNVKPEDNLKIRRKHLIFKMKLLQWNDSITVVALNPREDIHYETTDKNPEKRASVQTNWPGENAASNENAQRHRQLSVTVYS